MTVEIETPRLRLRQHRARDAEWYLPLTDKWPAAEELYRDFLAVTGGWTLFGFGSFAVEERQSGNYVGHYGLYRQLRDLGYERYSSGEPVAGWATRYPERGRGYATEAMTAAVDWYEATFGRVASVCMIPAGDAASERLAAKLGYQPTGPAGEDGAPVQYRRASPVWRTIATQSFVTEYKDAELQVDRQLSVAPATGGLAVALTANRPNGDYGLISIGGVLARPIRPVAIVTPAGLNGLPDWAEPYRSAIAEALADAGLAGA